MKHRAAPEFWDAFDDLPQQIQQLAEKKRDLMMKDPRMVNLKKASGYWSARVNRQHRALGIDHPTIPNAIAWFWIGKHDEYERILNE